MRFCSRVTCVCLIAACLLMGLVKPFAATEQRNTSGPAETKAPAYDFSRVDKFLEESLPRMGGGGSLILIKDNRVIYRKAFGAFKPEMVVPIASASKWISGGVIMALVSEGKLNLDDKASKYLPDFKGKVGEITIRQMFSHTHGWPEQPYHQRNTKLTLEEAAHKIAEVPLVADSGTALFYSGLGMQVAGRIAEVVTGKPWVEIFKEKIGEPCEMKSTNYYAFGETKNPNVAGSVQTNIDDYGNFVSMIANRGVFKGRRVLSEKAVAEMLRNQTGAVPIKRHPWAPMEGIEGAPSQSRYGIGAWLEGMDAKTGAAWEASSGGAFGCQPWVDLKRNLAAVFLPYSRKMKTNAQGLAYNEAFEVYLELKKILKQIIPENTAGANPRRQKPKAASRSSGNWPQFRGPNASGIADGQNAPARWNAETSVNIRWKTPIPGLGHSSPVIWGNRLFVTTAVSSEANAVLRNRAGRPYGIRGDIKSLGDEPGHSFRLYCLDKRTGKILWERVAYEGAPKIKRHPKATHANASPATDGEHIVAFFGSEGLYCYDFDGKLLWKKDMGVINAAFVLSNDQWSAASSPIIYRRLVIVQCDGLSDSFIAAYDIKDGREVWKTRRDEITSWATPSVYGGQPRVELITNASNYIRGYDPLTGKELWKLSGSSKIATPTPIMADGLIYVTNGYIIPGIQPIYAIRPGASGDISLKEDTTANEFITWSVKKGGSYIPTPLIYQGILYLLDDNGMLVFHDAKTGKQLDKVRAGDTGSVFSASPVAADGRVYLTSEDGDIFIIKAGPKYELLGTNPMGEVCMATPAISQEMIFVRTLRHIFGIGSLQ